MRKRAIVCCAAAHRGQLVSRQLSNTMHLLSPLKGWKMMSLRAVERTAKVAGPVQGASDRVTDRAKKVADGAEDAAAVDCVELCIRQLDDSRVRLFDVLHCGLLLLRLCCR